MECVICWKNIFGDFFDGSRISDRRHVNTTENAMSSTDNGSISPKQCYYEMENLFFICFTSWIPLKYGSTQLHLLSLTVKRLRCLASHFTLYPQNLQYRTHPHFWPSHRRIFKTSLYYKMCLILEKFDLEGHGPLSPSPPPKKNRDLNQGICTSGPNLVILSRMGDEL